MKIILAGNKLPNKCVTADAVFMDIENSLSKKIIFYKCFFYKMFKQTKS